MTLCFCKRDKCVVGQLNLSDYNVRAGWASVCVVSPGWLLPPYLTRHVAEPDCYTPQKLYFINSNK